MNPFAINISPSPKEIRLYLVILLLTTLTLLWRNTLYSYITAYTPSTPLIISLVPHSHCDAGWNKPLNDYYDQDVKYILQRVTLELLRNPARRFVWSDLQYVVTWLHEDGDNRVSPNTSSDVREFLARDGDTAVKFLESRATWRQLMGGEKGEGVTWRRLMWWLVHGGQFEFVGGGWIGHDEALVTPSSMVDNMEVGLEWLKREFGVRPRIGWQIDPFGHSDVTPVIFKQMGYDAMIMGRIDNRLRDKWSAQRRLHFLWSSPAHRTTPPLFTHLLHDHYSPPHPSFDLDDPSNTCSDPSRLLSLLVLEAARARAMYPALGPNHVLIPMGDDFKYLHAYRWFECLDRVMEEARRTLGREVVLRYATASEVIAPVLRGYGLEEEAARVEAGRVDAEMVGEVNQNKKMQVELPWYEGDFFPYFDKPVENYWTGFYATRPTLKGLIRETERLIRHSEILHTRSVLRSFLLANTTNMTLTASRIKSEDYGTSLLLRAKLELAISHHHDAITGTCTVPTYLDYRRRVVDALTSAKSVAHEAVSKVTGESDVIFVNVRTSTEPLILDEFACPPTDYVPVQETDEDSQVDRDGVGRECVLHVWVTNYANLWAVNATVRMQVPGFAPTSPTVTDDETGQVVPLVQAVALYRHNRVDLWDSAEPVDEKVKFYDPHFLLMFVATSIPASGARSYTIRYRLPHQKSSAKWFNGSWIPAAELGRRPATLEKGGVRVLLTLATGGATGLDIKVVEEGAHKPVSLRAEVRQYAITGFNPSGPYVFRSFGVQFAWAWAGVEVAIVTGASCAYVWRILWGLCGRGGRGFWRGWRRGVMMAIVWVLAGWSVGVGIVRWLETGNVDLVMKLAWNGRGAWWTPSVFFFLLGYTTSALLHPHLLHLLLFAFTIQSSIYRRLLIDPTQQSRPLPSKPNDHQALLLTGPVCDYLFHQINPRVQQRVSLCATDNPSDGPVLRLLYRATLDPDRELVARYTLDPDRSVSWAGAIVGPARCEVEPDTGITRPRRAYDFRRPLPGNYYPVVFGIAEVSGRSRGGAGVEVRTRQAMGGACLRPGMVEVMLHRRLMWDDGKGLEDVNDDKSEARVMNVVRVRKLKGREDMGGRWRADVMIENDVKVYEAKERAKVSMVWPVEGSRGKEIDADVVILAMRDKRLDETKMAVWVRVQTAPGAGVQRVGARELVGVEAGTGVALGRVVSLTDFVEDEKVGGDWDTMQEVVELAGGGGIEVVKILIVRKANDANGENN